MLTIMIQIRAENWKAARVAMRQAYSRDLRSPLRPGKDGSAQYELTVTDVQQDAEPFAYLPETR